MEDQHDSDASKVRIGDTEREAVLDALSEHHVKGRLEVEELDRRQRAALAAQTEADLAKLLVDLPELSPARPSMDSAGSVPSRPRLGQREEVQALVTWGPPTGVTLAGAAWVATAGPFPDESSQFVMAMGMAAVGFVSHWWVTRRRD